LSTTIHQNRYQELDALRGIAALITVLFHFTMHSEYAKYGFFIGITGVDLFFIISGFVIFMSVNHVSSRKEFIVNRITRLFPTYWTSVTLTFLVMLIVANYNDAFATISFIQYFGNLTMFQHYFGIQDLDGPYWSLIIELLFYIFIIIIFKKIDKIVLIGLAVLVFILLIYILPGTALWPYYLQIRAAIPLLNHFALFFAGILFYKLMKENDYKLVYYLLLVGLYFYHINGQSHDSIFIDYDRYSLTILSYFILFTLFVNNKLSFIVSKTTIFLGKISFALYLVHQYIGRNVLINLMVEKWCFNYVGALLIALIIVVGLATAITYYIEIPVGKKLNNFLRFALRLPKKVS